LQYADIILPLNLPRPLTYGIPLSLQGKVQPGSRVEVAMGRNKIYAGIVWEIHNFKPENFTVKPIRNLIDAEPIVGAAQLQFWNWISQYYMCSLGDVMNAALPAHLKLMSESLLIWNGNGDDIPSNLSDDAFVLAEALMIRTKLTIGEVRALLENKQPTKAINELLEMDLVHVSEILEDKYKERFEKFVLLHPDCTTDAALNEAFSSLEKAPKSLQLLMTFLQLRQQNAQVTQAELLKKAKASAAQLKTLLSRNILDIQTLSVDRLPFTLGAGKTTFSLSSEQNEALAKIKSSWEQHKATLLHGVTGSGKTLVYVQLIQEAIYEGKQCLFMLPEIALTTQVVSRLRSYFGEELGVYHSRFSNNERVEIWNKVKNGTYKVIVGPRSAIWLPFINLQYIVVDEEHDTSYKQQDPAPRFHARDAAVWLAGLYNARVLLGSATPSLESTFNASKDKFGYVALKNRYRGVALPEIEVVNARNTQAALSPLLTQDLLQQMEQTLQRGQQIILFQNKRGYAPFLMCSSCGHVTHCRNCDVSLTYHKSTDKLHCHYCGTKTQTIQHCPACGHQKIVARSFGTEKIEEELRRIFPKVKTARMDWDSTKTKDQVSRLFEDFARGRIDILVGTQMVVKGLDFENVGLVGIISADSLLSFPDFRINEKAFQLMQQVSGRAGRMDGKGKVIIQAYNEEHPVLNWVKMHDFKRFYQTEIAGRQNFCYPPFCRLIKLTCKDRNDEKAAKALQQIFTALDQIPLIRLQGPAPALVPRVRNYYLHELWIKVPKDAQLSQTKNEITLAVNTVLRQRGNSSLQISADVDPV